jgi:hypothetical protein
LLIINSDYATTVLAEAKEAMLQNIAPADLDAVRVVGQYMTHAVTLSQQISTLTSAYRLCIEYLSTIVDARRVPFDAALNTFVAQAKQKPGSSSAEVKVAEGKAVEEKDDKPIDVDEEPFAVHPLIE